MKLNLTNLYHTLILVPYMTFEDQIEKKKKKEKKYLIENEHREYTCKSIENNM